MPRSTPTPNAYQQAVLDFFADGQGSALVEAGPGTGKSQALLRCLSTVDLEQQRVWLAAFSNQVARDLAQQVPEHENLAVSTMHALGLLQIRRTVGTTHLWPQKYAHLAQLAATEQGGPTEEQQATAVCLEALATRAMLTLTDPTDPDALHQMALEHAVDMGAWEHAWPLVDTIVQEGREMAMQEGQIAYADMLYVPHALGLNGSPFDLVILDEAQDTSAAQRSLLLRALAPSARVLAAGDPHQAIYGWLGADLQAFGHLKTALEAEVFPLRVCYRCPHTHLALANAVYHVLDPAPRTRLGTVGDLTIDGAVRELRAGDLVLCRSGGPLVALAYRLIAEGKRTRLLGRDLGPELQAAITHTVAQPGFNEEEFGVHLGDYAAHAQQELEVGGEAAAMATATLWDRVHALRVIVDQHKGENVDTLRTRVRELTNETLPGNAIELGTVHRAKGMEANRVFLLRPELLPHPRAVTPMQQEQEQNLRFVALTRSKNALYFVHS